MQYVLVVMILFLWLTGSANNQKPEWRPRPHQGKLISPRRQPALPVNPRPFLLRLEVWILPWRRNVGMLTFVSFSEDKMGANALLCSLPFLQRSYLRGSGLYLLSAIANVSL